MPNLTEAPSSLLDALQEHLNSLEGTPLNMKNATGSDRKAEVAFVRFPIPRKKIPLPWDFIQEVWDKNTKTNQPGIVWDFRIPLEKNPYPKKSRDLGSQKNPISKLS